MIVLSLFDGLAGARIALERAKIKVNNYYTSELDKYAIKIAMKNYPRIIQIGDINNLDFNKFRNVDLIIGGSPCQDLSIAKKDRKGLSGKRSGLFWKFVEAIKMIKPKYFLLENVNSMNKENKKIITEVLKVEPIMINSALLTAQNRKRLYWCNWQVGQPEDKEIYLKAILENDVNEKYFLSNLQLFNLNKIKDGIKRSWFCGKHQQLTYIGKNNLYCIGIIPESIKPKGNYLPRERIFSIKGKFRTISTVSNQQPLISNNFKNYVRRLTPIECERLQTIPDNYTEGVSNTQRYKMIGNSFTIDVIAHLLSFIKL